MLNRLNAHILRLWHCAAHGGATVRANVGAWTLFGASGPLCAPALSRCTPTRTGGPRRRAWAAPHGRSRAGLRDCATARPSMGRDRLAELRHAAAAGGGAAPVAAPVPLSRADGAGAGPTGAGASNGDQQTIEMAPISGADDGFMASFFQTVAEVRADLDQIERKTAEVGAQHEQALTAISQKDAQRCSTEADRIMGEVQQLAIGVRNHLKAIDRENRALETQSAGSAEHKKGSELRIRQAQHSLLSRKFIKVMTAYNEMQQQHKQRYRERVERQFRIGAPGVRAMRAVRSRCSDAPARPGSRQ